MKKFELKNYLRIIFLCPLALLTACESTGQSSSLTSSQSHDLPVTAESFASEDNLSKSEAKKLGYVVVTDYIEPNSGKDISKQLQTIIDSNPRRTIYFPDGYYIIDSPLVTPAHHQKCVDIRMSNYAVIKAGLNWDKSNTAMIRLGGKDPENNIAVAGTNYSISGGVLDGNGIANGISIESGRETQIHDLSIKNTVIGIHILHGANSGSSDADIHNVNIYGNGKAEAKGVVIEGYDNTLTNMRIGNVRIGIEVHSGGNVLRNIHPLFIAGPYASSYGFYDSSRNRNWYDYCYSDQFRYGYYLESGCSAVISNGFTFWYANWGDQTAVYAAGNFASLINEISVDFNGDGHSRAILETSGSGGCGVIENILADKNTITDNTYENYLTGKVIG